ncbi:MAG: HD domain-containing protein [Deltaproteobacteria bacterium]|nr:HD domain-containing protein [Deltaproteobacteria bacterium]
MQPMLKKITINQLIPGMFIDHLDRSWLSMDLISPRVKSREDVEKLKAMGVAEVYIDPVKGNDLPDSLGLAQKALSGAVPAAGSTYLGEISGAHGVYQDAQSAVTQMMRMVQRGEAPSMATVRSTVEKMIDSILRNRDALTSLVTLKENNQSVFQHCIRVAILSLAVGSHIGFNIKDMKTLGMGAMLHDIGKMKLPRQVAEKTAPLNEQEYQKYKEHALLGARLLDDSQEIEKNALLILLHHHERPDGTGFPQGLSNDTISAYARIVSIADAFDNLLHKPQSTEQLTPHDTLHILRQWGGKALDGDLVEQFIAAMGIYPAGSLVRLSDHRLAIVLSSKNNSSIQPRVWIVFDANQRMLPLGEMVDLSALSVKPPLTVVEAVNPGRLGFDLIRYVSEKGLFTGVPQMENA